MSPYERNSPRDKDGDAEDIGETPATRPGHPSRYPRRLNRLRHRYQSRQDDHDVLDDIDDTSHEAAQLGGVVDAGYA